MTLPSLFNNSNVTPAIVELLSSLYLCIFISDLLFSIDKVLEQLVKVIGSPVKA